MTWVDRAARAVGWASLLAAACYSARSYGFREAVDLCSVPTVAVVGRVAALDSAWSEDGGRRHVVTQVLVTVERVVLGAPLESVEFSILGGEVDGVRVEGPESPEPRVGDRYLWFLANWPAHGGYYWVDRRALDPRDELPPEIELRDAWEQLCWAHPEGVPPVGNDATTETSGVLDWERVREVEMVEPVPMLQGLLELRACPSRKRVQDAMGIMVGICLGGHLDRPQQGGW